MCLWHLRFGGVLFFTPSRTHFNIQYSWTTVNDSLNNCTLAVAAASPFCVSWHCYTTTYPLYLFLSNTIRFYPIDFWSAYSVLARADQKQKQKWHFWSGFWISKMDLHFWVLEAFKNGLPFFSLFLVPYWDEKPETKTKTPFLFLFLTSLLEWPKIFAF